jgi:CRISPR-associated protein Csm3
MTIPFGHYRLQNRYCFSGVLELVSPMHISAGIASDTTDSPFVTQADGTPYIPGSSLRGAIRSELERILGAVGSICGISSCTLFEEGDCAARARRFLLETEASEDATTEVEPVDRNKRLAEYAERELCDLCKLFGSTLYASKLFFQDALPASTPKRCIRDGVGIDRDTGAARDGVKFDYEVLEKGARFTFEMAAENVGDSDKKIINIVLKMLKEGLYVGAKRGSGLGKIKLLKEGELYYRVKGFESAEALWKALKKGAPIHDAVSDWEEVL